MVDARRLYTRDKVSQYRAQMVRLRVVNPDEEPEEVTPEDLERLVEVVARLRALLDSPIALMERARELLEGTAEPLF